jgi:hypothetical protein
MSSTPTESSHDEKRQEDAVDIDGFQPVDSAAERRLVRKLDMQLLLCLALAYLLGFIDVRGHHKFHSIVTSSRSARMQVCVSDDYRSHLTYLLHHR